MIVKQYIKNFEKMGFGMFVHFGLYSLLGRDEWALHQQLIPDEAYEALAQKFSPTPAGPWSLWLPQSLPVVNILL